MTADAAEIVRLAERVEQATGATTYSDARAIDDAIYTLQTGKKPFNSATALRYTASLDDAMSLVPEGMEWGVGFIIDPDSGREYFAGCGKQVRPIASHSPALALTAAALRARAASALSDGQG